MYVINDAINFIELIEDLNYEKNRLRREQRMKEREIVKA